MATDTAFTPPTRLSFAQGFNKTIEEIAEVAEDAPIYSFFVTLIQQLFTWQAYTLIMMGVGENWFERKAAKEKVESPEKNEDGTIRRTYGLSGSLFNPYSPYFNELDARFIIITDAAILVTFLLLHWVGRTYGWGNLILWYCIPYVLINSCVSKLQTFPQSLSSWFPISLINFAFHSFLSNTLFTSFLRRILLGIRIFLSSIATCYFSQRGNQRCFTD